MHRRFLPAFFVCLGLLVFGCTTTNATPAGSGTGTGTGTGGASTEQIDRCKKSCDKMKFFDCSSADEQARCYADCDKAAPSQIDVFTGCAENSICDPECRTTIQPKETATQGGGGATASSCGTACDKLVSCSFIPVGAKSDCEAECSTKGYQYQIDCVNKTACEKIEATCGGAGGGSSTIEVDGGSVGDSFAIAKCQSECDSINFFDCTDVSKHADCRAKCGTASATARDTFTSCSGSSGTDCTKKSACLDAFLK